MNKTMRCFALVCAGLGQSLAYAGDLSVGVTIEGEVKPGVYGRVEIGNRPPPPVVYVEPVVIVHRRERRVLEPIYLHVPPGHAKHWSKHCAKYNACDRPVYFVKSEEYEPGYAERHGKHGKRDKHGRGRGHND